ncbi:tetratricopeptide repeat-containing sulfotransferase family protein [Lysobacter terrae]
MNHSVETKEQRLWQQGEAYASRGDWARAAAAFEGIISHNPGHLPALLKSSAALLKLDRYRTARERVLSALPLAIDHPGLTLELARKLRELHEPARLLALLDRSTFVRCGHAQMLTEMALIVSSIGDQERALTLTTAATQADPRHAQARYMRGTALMFLGRMDEAEQELEAAIRLLPLFPQPHWVLSRLRKWSSDRNHIDRLRQLLKQTPRDSEAEAYLSNALHNELHDLGDYEGSWQALDRYCRVKNRLEPYQESKTRELFAAIKSLCTADFVKSAPRDDDFVPIFIIGMHRSGTTLLERILGGHSMVADGGETYSFTAQIKIATDHKCSQSVDPLSVQRLKDADFDAMGRGFIADSKWRAKGKPFLTEKLPPNLLNAGFVAKAIPNARILHMVRDPVDTCFSNLRTYFTNAALYSFNQLDVANYVGHYRDLMEHWRTVMPSRVLDISYDGLVNDTEATVRGIFDFCGLPFEADALNVERSSGAVSTASTAHVRQGILTNRGAAWKPYEAHLQPMIDRLQELGAI